MLSVTIANIIPTSSSQLMPTPKWKLVVDIGMAPPKEDSNGKPTDIRVEEVLKLVTENSVRNVKLFCSADNE